MALRGAVMMTKSLTVRIKAEDAISTFLRLYALFLGLEFLGILATNFSAFGFYFLSGEHQLGDKELWPLYAQLIRPIALMVVAGVLFGAAGPIARLVAGKLNPLEIDGSEEYVAGLALQLLGITMVVHGLGRSGDLVVDFMRVQEAGSLYKTDAAYWRALVQVVVEASAGLLLLLKPAVFAGWMKTRR
jgi:hypothetical protein